MTIRWTWDHSRTLLQWIKIRHLPRRATVQISCRGRGCAKHLVFADVGRLGRLLLSLERHTYWAGDRLGIMISEPGYRPERIGIRIRNGQLPAVGLL